jgi:hypothetical protein
MKNSLFTMDSDNLMFLNRVSFDPILVSTPPTFIKNHFIPKIPKNTNIKILIVIDFVADFI